MQLIETNIAQRGLLPLPAAALVIDIRGINDDEVVERLNIEIADLASEMKTYDVHHWRRLEEFLSFTTLDPASAFDGGRDEQTSPAVYKQGPMGPMQTPDYGSSLFLQDDQDEQGNIVNGDFDIFEQHVSELILEINRLRNHRITAVADLNKAGIPGRSAKDTTVRVIFLTDVERPESLRSAAIYAQRIKDYYRKRERFNQQLVNTTVLCIGNSGEAGPPKQLIEGLLRNNRWDHLDTLILSEEYREDAALIAGTMQAYLAELLLYVLLIIPPFGINSSRPAPPVPQIEDKDRSGERITLPPNTFVLGLATLEYSARWGRRWLSYGLANETVKTLLEPPIDENIERKRTGSTVESWLQNWRSRVRSTIPDKVPGEVSALEGIREAQRVANPSRIIFTARQFSPHIGETTITDLEKYKDELVRTYAATAGEPTLQEAVLRSTPQLIHTLRQREQKPLADRKTSELAALEIEAEQILSEKNFFTGATGAIPRARTELELLGKKIADVHEQRNINPLNPAHANEELLRLQGELQQNGQNVIENLKKHIASWPFLSAFLPFKGLLAVLSLLLIFLMTMVVVLLGFAWLNHLLVVKNIGFVSYLDTPIFGVPTLELIAWGLIITIAIVGAIFLKGVTKLSALKVEILFWLLLLSSALFGLLVAYSITNLSNQVTDAVSIDLLVWLSFVPGYARFAFAAAIVIFAVEVFYFAWWLNRLHNEREGIVRQLYRWHQTDVDAVIAYIADETGLEILRRAELTDGSGGQGAYYQRIDSLYNLLLDMDEMTEKQQQLASNRLLLSQSETQEGFTPSKGKPWRNLNIRDERLQTKVLTDGYQSLQQKLLGENESLREFTEFLLRIAGVEKPIEIGQWFDQKHSQVRGEERRFHILANALVATAFRFTVDPLAVRSIDSMLDQYKSATEYARRYMPTLNFLIDILGQKMSQATLRATADKKASNMQYLDMNTSTSNIAVDALATWMQMFWQGKDSKVDEALTQDGVLAHLARMLGQDYDPRALMRHLQAHASLFGRSMDTNRQGDVFLLLAPSSQSYRLRQGLKNLKIPHIIDFPDVERILLLGVQYYVAEPLFLDAPKVLPNAISNGASQTTHLSEDVDDTIVQSDLFATNGHNGHSEEPTNGPGEDNHTSVDPAVNTVPLSSSSQPQSDTVVTPTMPVNLPVSGNTGHASSATTGTSTQVNHNSTVDQGITVPLTPPVVVNDTMKDGEK